jgi:uncharacterized protein (DUF1800 family)
MERFLRALKPLFCFAMVLSAARVTAQSALSGASPSVVANQRQLKATNQLHGDQKILHALNRFTFGPRPGDLEQVRAIGLDKWFDRQLHPATLGEMDLDTRLAQFPAMQAQPEDLLRRFPTNAVINQTTDGKLPMPASPVLRTVYEAQKFRLQVKKQQDPKKAVADGMAVAKGGGMMSQPTQPQLAQAGSAQTMSGMSSVAGAASDDSMATLISLILGLPPQQRVERLCAMKPSDLDGFFHALKGPQRAALLAGLEPAMKEQVGAMENPQRVIIEELVDERLTRDIYSNAQLQEVMTDFWLNHFNVFLHKDEVTPYYLVSFERDTIRPRALGKFEDLLQATAHSPAMLLYLDNATSTGPDSQAVARMKIAAEKHPGNRKKAPDGLNENYARELMELHTLSVNGGYTQKDVTQVASIFTGWTVDRQQVGGSFKFDPGRHEPGDKKVMGVKFKENGELEGQELLHFLAMRPATARFIARKLAVRFVSDDPPESLVSRMQKSYLRSDGDISAVLRTLFHSPEFWASSAYRAKVKTPIEFVVSAVRSSNASINDLQPLANAMRDMAMPVFGAIPPTGYNWQASAWISTGALVNRMNFAMTFASGRLSGVAVHWMDGPDATRSSPALVSDARSELPGIEAEESRLEPLLVAGGVSPSTRAAALQQTQIAHGTAPVPPAAAQKPPNRGQQLANLNREDQQIAGLLLGSPEFQRR